MALPLVTQSQMVEEISEETGFAKGEIRHMLTALTEFVEGHIAVGNRVKIAHVTIEPKLKKARKKRMGRNPQTGEAVQIPAKPASTTVKARVGKTLMEKAPSVKKLRARQ